MTAGLWALGERASALIAAGRPAAALPLLSRCAAAGAGWALLLRARAKAALGRPALAEADVTRAFDLDPDCGWIFGLSVGPLEVPGEGKRLFETNRSFHDEKSCYAARAFHGKLAIMAGLKDEGLAHLDWAAKAAPRRPYLFSWRGEARRRLGDLAGARADARRALSLDPRYAVAWTTLAAVERQSGRPAAALESARRAARCGPWYENAPLEAARACLALGDVRGVLTWLERAARRSSRLGWTNLGEGRASPAPDPETLLRDAPWRGTLLAWCGEFLLSRGEHARALDLLNAASHPFAPAWRGEARLALGDAAGAERDLRTAVAAAPRYARAWAALARARFELGRLRPALAACDRALALEPDWAWALYQRGRVLGALGKKEAALRDLDACLAIDRRFEAARLERARLA
ncbi:MAG: tetratricopeptide repeat protein [Elusimicrobia bacterium]|nr:tetratricopeptide repeat protein [Elusimicrobiota bacterium]